METVSLQSSKSSGLIQIHSGKRLKFISAIRVGFTNHKSTTYIQIFKYCYLLWWYRLVYIQYGIVPAPKRIERNAHKDKKEILNDTTLI